MSGEGFVDLSHEDVEELLWEESLNEEELLEFIDASTSNVSVEENADNESVTNFISDDVKNGLATEWTNGVDYYLRAAYYLQIAFIRVSLWPKNFCRKKRTFISGTIKVNKKFLPSKAKQKQQRDGIVSFQNRSGVKFLKWTDKRPVCMLTTSRNHMCTIVQGKNNKLKPDIIFFFITMQKRVLI